MNRPYIICHMVTSLDGKVTGEFLSRPECEKATEIYYDINRSFKSDGFICGRVTMAGSFTGGWYPELSEYEYVTSLNDYVPDDMTGFYAVAFDTNGMLGWKTNRIVDPDGDPGYDCAQIIEVLSENTNAQYLGYLQAKEIPYIFAGKTKIDVELALRKLKNIFGAQTLLLEGGSIINGAFQRADVIDELSLVVAPVVAASEDKPLFMNSITSAFELTETTAHTDVVILNFKRKINVDE